MDAEIPNFRAARFSRLAALIWLGLFLVWLPFEDVSTNGALLLGVLGVLWLILRFVVPLTRSGVLRIAGFGALAGLLTTLATLFLLFFKSALHAHGFSDYTAFQYLAVLSNLPLLVALGFIMGLLVAWLGRSLFGKGDILF